MPRTRLLALLLVTAVAAGSLGVGATWAVTTFSDVPPDHPFAEEIAAVAGACVAGGFPDGTYRPGNDVTRQAMAAFLARGLGQVEVADGTPTVLPGNDSGTVTAPLTLATVDVTIPALPECTQYVELTGRASVDIPGLQLDKCNAQRCTVTLQLYEDEELLGNAEAVLSGNFDVDVVTVNAVVPAAGGTHTYTLAAVTWLLKADSGSAHDIRLIAETHPFSSTAG